MWDGLYTLPPLPPIKISRLLGELFWKINIFIAIQNH